MEQAYDIIRLNGGNLLTLNETNSNDGDVASAGHGQSDTWVVEFTNPTGIDEPSSNVQLVVYPNPANKTVTIDLPSQKMVDQIEILNAHGQVVAVQYPKQRAILIDISTYSSGFYFVKVNQGQKFYYPKVIVSNDFFD